MIVVAVVAAKGGVGRSTIAANLSVVLSRHGRRVLAVDLDPQNALHLHMGGKPEDLSGLARASVGGASWSDVCVRAPSGVDVLPFGRLDETDLLALEQQIAGDPHWLSHRLQRLELPDDTVVILDTPPGISSYLRQALSAASFVVSVMLADAASYATLPQIENLILRYQGMRPGSLESVCIINQVDDTLPLSSESVDLIRNVLGERVIGLVRADRFVSEALAHGQTVFESSTDSNGRADLMQCAAWMLRRLEMHSQPIRAVGQMSASLDDVRVIRMTDKLTPQAEMQLADLAPALQALSVPLSGHDRRPNAQAASSRSTSAYWLAALLLFVLLVLLLVVLRVGAR
jgi:cellulose synthase operon protein YhjQ